MTFAMGPAGCQGGAAGPREGLAFRVSGIRLTTDEEAT